MKENIAKISHRHESVTWWYSHPEIPAQYLTLIFTEFNEFEIGEAIYTLVGSAYIPYNWGGYKTSNPQDRVHNFIGPFRARNGKLGK